MILSCLCLICGALKAEDAFEYRDFGWEVRGRFGPTYKSNGFAVGGKGPHGIRKAEKVAKIESQRSDDRYNSTINRIGEAGHGVAYPLYPTTYAAPVYVPMPIPVPDPYPVLLPSRPARVIEYKYWP